MKKISRVQSISMLQFVLSMSVKRYILVLSMVALNDAHWFQISDSLIFLFSHIEFAITVARRESKRTDKGLRANSFLEKSKPGSPMGNLSKRTRHVPGFLGSLTGTEKRYMDTVRVTGHENSVMAARISESRRINGPAPSPDLILHVSRPHPLTYRTF